MEIAVAPATKRQAPPPPAPTQKTRPKITLQIPDMQSKGPTTAGPMYWQNPRFQGKNVPITPVSHISDPQGNPYFHPFMQMYPTKASDFMFKQFEGFKDFTMNTAKSGLSVGEKTAFWFYNKLSQWSKKWFTHLFLTLCLAAYSALGAVTFMALEGPHEEKISMNLTKVREDITKAMYKDTFEQPSVLLNQDQFRKALEVHMRDYATNYTLCKSQYGCIDEGEAMKNKTWGFWNSMFYAGTIYTTIGYGHIAPKTTYGRVATIAYAIIGIPLFLIVLADFGKLFTRIIKFFWSFIRRFYYTRSCKKMRHTVPVQEVMKGLNLAYNVVRRPSQMFNEEDFQNGNNGNSGPPPIDRKPSDAPPPLPPKPGQTIIVTDPEDDDPGTPAPSVFEIDDEFNLPISVAIIILIIYILIGALVYHCWETWNFFESFYFVFISMSTIGLGDLVPDHPMFMMASILYLVFGLALTSMCINVVQLKLSNTFKQASAKLGATIGLKVADEDGSLVPMTPEPTETVPVHKPKEKFEDGYKDGKESNF